MGSTASFWKSSRAPLLCLQLNWSPTTGSGIRYLSQSRLLSSAVVALEVQGVSAVLLPVCFVSLPLSFFIFKRREVIILWGACGGQKQLQGPVLSFHQEGPGWGLPTVSLALLKIFLIVLRKSLSFSLKLRHDFRDCSNSIPLPQPL